MRRSTPRPRPVLAVPALALRPLFAVPALALVPALLPAAAPAAPLPAVPGTTAPGIGDPMFPALGDGGYDVAHYDLSFAFGADVRRFQARTVIDARATRDLPRFGLDLAGNRVRGVTVDGVPARFTRTGEKLVVTPSPAPVRGRRFRIAVTYDGTPVPHPGPGPDETKGWFTTADGFFTAPQPDAAHSIFPSNDHPSDKATLTVHLTIPSDRTAAASGVLTGRRRLGDRTVWTFDEREPVATEVVQVSVGRSAVVRQAGPHGLPLRSVVPAADAAALTPVLAGTARQVAWLERRLGRYPFATYGVLGVPSDLGFAEETQTLSVFNVAWLRGEFPGDYPLWLRDVALAHELTHQWFGNSVTPRHWSDVWLSEGPATYYSYLYAASLGGPAIDDVAHAMYSGLPLWAGGPPVDGDQVLRARYGAPAAPLSGATLYSDSVYNGGLLTLYALRQKIGPRSFDALMRAWVTAHRHGNASTADFIGTAARAGGPGVANLLRSWLYGTATPPMPGHPGWALPARGADHRRAVAAPSISRPAL